MAEQYLRLHNQINNKSSTKTEDEYIYKAVDGMRKKYMYLRKKRRRT